MEWKFTDDIPIYQQIMNMLKQEIASGELAPGQKLPSVRELALEAKVNPNTMQKALAELEREGLLYSQRTAGRFVAEQQGIQDGLQEELMLSYFRTFLPDLHILSDSSYSSPFPSYLCNNAITSSTL